MQNDPTKGNDREKFGKGSLLRSTVLAGFAATAFAATPALAQETEEDDEEEEQQQESRTTDRVVVTGSLLRRNEFTSSSPIQVITSETASLEGLLDTSEILQESSIAAGSTQINTQFGGFIVNGGPGVNTVSLRGLGAQRTLLLFNGRRFGPSGVQGRVGAVDLNTIPQSVVQRIEILKDGAGSIYGSDAVAGVINVITRTEIDAPQLSTSVSLPFESGGESYTVDGAIGRSFDRGFVTLSAAYNRVERLQRSDRDYFTCPQDYVFDPVTGARVDRIERNPLSDNQGNFKCFNSGVVNAVDIFTFGAFDPTTNTNNTRRLIIDPGYTGAGDGYFEGFRPRAGNGLGSQLGVEETDTDDPRLRNQDILPQTERFSVYLTGEYDVGFANLYGELLYNNRTTDQVRNRQFFPWSGNPAVFGNTDPGTNAHMAGVGGDFGAGDTFGTPLYARPITLIPFNTQVDIDYFYGVVGANGEFGPNAGFFSNWSWDTHLSHSISDGSYTSDTVDARNVVDFFDARTEIRHVFDPAGNVVCERLDAAGNVTDSCPAINYFTPEFQAGQLTDAERAFLLTTDTGSTEYTQTLFNAVITGEAFELPAGPVGLALGVEYRRSEIDDQPGPLSRSGNQWGLSSAVVTQGEDDLYEAFAEVEVPIIAGRPFFEELTLSASGRVFDYKLYEADSVYKLGLNWQVHPVLRLRSTFGTSYRAPGLFELYLGDQTGFLGQAAVDPCIEWGESTNQQIRTNCAADGIPDDYAGIGSSATSISQGGAGQLTPETSEAFTAGFILTPTNVNLSIALDYFEIEVNDQVAQLTGGAILGGCYSGTQFPNAFCNLFDRAPAGQANEYNILEIRNQFININSQRTEGLDITLRYEHEFDFGELTYDLQGTWTFEDLVDTFEGVDGFATNEFNGTLGDPDFVAGSNLRFIRGDYTFSWFTDFVSRMSNDELFGGNIFPFNGSPTLFKQFTEPYFQHGASVRYRGADWVVTAGVSNIFDEHPAAVSTGTDNRLGNTSLSATQFDLRGRSAFFQLVKNF
ncbi:MAG: TonB-dependent receptor [Oceanicaulis sp.]